MICNIEAECPACGAGIVGFRVCSDRTTLVLMCDECDAIWTSPILISLDTALFPSAPDFRVAALDCSLRGSRWAVEEEVIRWGWGLYMGGPDA